MDEKQEIKLRVAGNFNTSIETLDVLSGSKDVKIRRMVSLNFNTSTETLDKLSKDKDLIVKTRVASHNNTSQITLDKLAKANVGIAVDKALNREIVHKVQ